MKFLYQTNGVNSSSKFWKSVAYATATYIVAANAANPSWEILCVYMAVVGGSEVAMRLVKLRETGGSK